MFVLLSFCFSYSAFSQRLTYSEEEQKWINRHPIIYFGYDPNWPPYEIYTNGKYSGICAEYLSRVSKKTGIRFVPIKNMTWESSLHQLMNGTVMMVPSAGITPDRKKRLIYTDIYVDLPIVIATTKEKSDIHHLSELKGKTISIPKNYMQEEKIRRDFPEIKLILRPNFAECLQDVSSGVSEATVGSLGAINYFINQRGFTNLTIACHTHYSDNGVAFAFPKEQDTLRNIVNQALRSINSNERNKINAKWITMNYKQEVDYSTLWSYIILISISLGFVLLLFYLWNKSLRKQIDLRKTIEHELQHTLEEVKKQDNDKTVLLQEIHHRVKNNLQIIISLLRLQAGSSVNPDTQSALNEAIERVNSISLVHEHIYKNPNLAQIDLSKYIQNMAEELKRVFIRDKKIEFDIHTNDIQLNIKSIIPIALILNELITNSLKYAFRNRDQGVILIHFSFLENQLLMNYADDGDWFHNPDSGNFGSYLIEIFTDQLSGNFSRLSESHAEYEFRFDDY